MITILSRQILDSSERKVFEDNNLKFYDNCKEFSKNIENTVGKGEIARYEQFLLFQQCFQKDFYGRHVKTRAVWERVGMKSNVKTIFHCAVIQNCFITSRKHGFLAQKK